MSPQLELPERFTGIDAGDALEEIAAIKSRMGSRLLILGHHYQCDEIIRFADCTGDSFKLARLAKERSDAEFIVFCGVHFMAESADVLTGDDQTVILPDLGAGCSMADMASLDQVEVAWDALTAANGDDAYLPITYMNSSAAIKAFCGRHGGVVCTSSNARSVYEWALARGKKLIFLPDQHLGRNVGYEMGIPLDEMRIWDPLTIPEDNFDDGVADAKVVLWKGHCSVHGRFMPEHVDEMRERHPGIRIIAHPECTFEVVQKADESGSTERIIRAVTDSPPGSVWAVGTEIHLIHRLARENPDKTVLSLSGISCLCSTMYRIDPPHLHWALENLERGVVVNRIKVEAETAKYARIALDRMLSLT